MFGNKKMPGGWSYSDMYIPSWIAVNLLTTALFTIGTVLAAYREQGVLRRYQATPVHSWMVLGAYMLYGTLIFLISAVVIVVFGWSVYHLDAPKYPLSVITGLLLSILALLPFGLFLTSLAKNSRTATAISSLFLNLMLFLSGATFPLEMMPSILQKAAKILPLYYVVDLLRRTWNESSIWDCGRDVTVLIGIAAASIVLSIRFFRWGD
ncbi:ABC transporter permease [Polycladomyces subterraneus]|uniref:ABC transporter permease n=1 Tax=Polycladomyces subterraneus TaxID=1016997 RepID=A0ABT8IMP7_9BACL|nr:ABC transporter permease [Polycladomyces subterraneus]MDN4593806.1 ABC transporter permease [Polycladomyces subterraneus]